VPTKPKQDVVGEALQVVVILATILPIDQVQERGHE
jgi:hypothetical protein